MKEKNCSSVGCLPTRPGLWWKLIQITKQMKKIKLLLAQINFPSEEDIPVWSIVIPQEGAISPSHNPIWSDVMQNIAQWMKNRSMQIMQYKISCTIILNRYLSASALKVFWKLFRLRMQPTEQWTSVNGHFIAKTRFINTCRFIFFLPPQGLGGAQQE